MWEGFGSQLGAKVVPSLTKKLFKKMTNKSRWILIGFDGFRSDFVGFWTPKFVQNSSQREVGTAVAHEGRYVAILDEYPDRYDFSWPLFGSILEAKIDQGAIQMVSIF